MEELIKIKKTEKGDAVSAREVYSFLGFSKTQWKRWYEKNIIKNSFSIEGEDYVGFDIVSNGNNSKDFALTIDFAKRIAMMAKTPKGEQARRYFLECEKKALNPLANLTRVDILRMALEAEEKISIQENELRIQAPKVKYHDQVLTSTSTYNANQIAKELGTSAITLNRMLSKRKIQYTQNKTWLLYSKYQNKGYTRTKTYTYTDSNGDQKTSMQTVWTEKGREFIHEIFNSNLKTA